MVWTILCLGCGGAGANEPPSQVPEESQPVEPPRPTPSASVEASPPPEKPVSDAPPAAQEPPARPAFPDRAGVEAAILAIPQGMPRLNMSEDALQRPLMDMARYESCKVPRSMKVSVRVAVYDGAAVGVDVASKPKNAKIEGCIDGVVRSLKWDKVPSLNTVEFGF